MPLMPVAEALAKVLERAAPLAAEQAKLSDAHRRVLAESLVARHTQPPSDVSAMDGYAVRAADVAAVPATLKVIGEVAAGRSFSGTVGKGEAARIFTGGVVPPSADTIVIQENVKRDGERILVETGSPPGKHIRRAGLDFREGATLLDKGRRLSGRDLALAAAMNHATVAVHRRPKVAVLATGDELVMPGEQRNAAQIFYSNGYSIMALVSSEGAEVINLGIVPDKIDETVAALRRARTLGADVLVTSGGASVGDYDLVQKALAAEGVELSFWKVAMRPGRPLMHGLLGTTQVLGLPGNPVSAFVCSLLYLVPLLRKLAGRTDLEQAPESAILGTPLPANDERADYIRAGLTRSDNGQAIATPYTVQDSSMQLSLANADCLIIRAPLAPAAAKGEPCSIVKLPL